MFVDFAPKNRKKRYLTEILITFYNIISFGVLLLLSQ